MKCDNVKMKKKNSIILITCVGFVIKVALIVFKSSTNGPRQANLVLIAYAVSPEPSLLAHTSSESRGTFRQKTRSLALLNGWACAVEICHDGMLEDTFSLDGVQMSLEKCCGYIRHVHC